MDEFDKVDLTLIEYIGIDKFQEIVTNIGGKNFKVKALYVYDTTTAYHILKIELGLKIIRAIELYNLCLPDILLEIRNIRINKILDN